MYFNIDIYWENLNYRDLFVDKGSGSGIFPDPDPGDPNRPDPDPDPQHWLKGSSFSCLVLGYTKKISFFFFSFLIMILYAMQ